MKASRRVAGIQGAKRVGRERSWEAGRLTSRPGDVTLQVRTMRRSSDADSANSGEELGRDERRARHDALHVLTSQRPLHTWRRFAPPLPPTPHSNRRGAQLEFKARTSAHLTSICVFLGFVGVLEMP